jgi:hypothetical protein
VLLQVDRAITALAVLAAAAKRQPAVYIAASLSLSLWLSSLFPEVSLFFPRRFYRFVQSASCSNHPACVQTELKLPSTSANIFNQENCR